MLGKVFEDSVFFLVCLFERLLILRNLVLQLLAIAGERLGFSGVVALAQEAAAEALGRVGVFRELLFEHGGELGVVAGYVCDQLR